MYKFHKTHIAIFLLSALIFTNNAIAKACYEPSPNLVNLGDEYYDLENTKTSSSEEKNKLKDFLRNLSGQWKGQLTSIECRGPDSAPRKIVKNAMIATKHHFISTGQLAIAAKKNYLQEKTIRHENLTLPSSSNIFGLLFPQDNKLVFSEKFRKANRIKKTTSEKKQAKAEKKDKKLSSRLIESIVEITLNASGLTLTRAYYTNGVYIGEETWSMNAE